MLLGQFLELAQEPLRHLVGSLLISGITVVDATREWPAAMRATEVALLVGTAIGESRTVGGRWLFEKYLGFKVAQKKHVIELFEMATASTGQTHGTGLGNCPTDLVIEFQDLAAEFWGHFISH
jgi:hypothetical protein